MLSKDVLKHGREFLRYMRNFQYERTDTGILFPKASAHFSGQYTHWINDDMSTLQSHANMIPDEGLIYLLGVGVAATTPITSWYMALYSAAYTPTNTLTAANFAGTASEITSASEGYDETNRVLWVPNAIDEVNVEVTNTTVPAAFTISTATTLAVNGAALLSVATKGSTSGDLVSAGRFPATRNLSDTDTFNVKYKVDCDAL
jgi:hypothetical protein